MMNPMYLPPGQNNNAPSNPLSFPPSQDSHNGVQNANYGQTNGPPSKPYDQNDMSQKMQTMNLNGPQGFGPPPSQLPPGQLPPGQLPPGQFPPGGNFPQSGFGPGQVPPGQRPPGSFPPGRPPVSGAPPQMQPPMGQKPQMPPPSSTPGPVPTSYAQGFQGPPSGQSNYPQGPPMSSQPSQHSGPSMSQQPSGPPGPPGPQGPGQMPPQQGLPPQPSRQPGLPPPGQKPGMPPLPQGFQQSGLPQPGLPQGLPPQQQGLPQPQSGLPPQQGGLPPQPQSGLPPQQTGGLPPQPGLSRPGLPPQPSQGLPPSSQGLPPQSSSQPLGGLPPQQLSQPGLPPQPGLQGMLPQGLSQPGLPSQPGQLPPQGLSQPGLPPQPYQSQGFNQPGLPPQPGQPGQYQMPGLPHMPPPASQQRQYQGMPPAPQPGYGQQPGYAMAPMPTQQQPQYQPQSGYPPQFPAQQPSYPGQQYQQPQKQLDPDHMPSPIQVMADDQANRGGVFVTNEKGQVPPLVTTDFVVDDKGNASPRYIRSSMYSVPVTADLLKQTSVPFCVVISPMAETVGAELEPPLLDFAALTNSPSMGPVRCSRCKAYMCPNMKFIDAGRHFKCAFCKATTEVPMEYTQYINGMQQYGRVPAEMALGAYEIVATKEYCRNNTLPNPPAIVFVIDVSYNSIKSGLLECICENILSIIEAMPKDEQTGKSWTRVGFITYSSTVHFYNIKGSLAQPQMLSVGDVSDMFVPLLEGFLSLPEESGSVLTSLLQQLPAMFQGNKETETILLPAVQAGLEALKAADTAGQLLVFHTTLPTYNAPGKLVNREERKLLGTDKEKQILAPQSTAYNELGQSCSAAGVSVELFVCNNSYVDAATIGQLPRLTGGQLHKYTYFTADVDGPRLVQDVSRVVSRPSAHDAVMRVRCSTGVRATDFFGHFFMSNTTDVELAAIDSDKAIGIEIKHDDKLTNEDGVYIQAALLYTARSGQRRLRVLNLALNVAQQLADVYRSVELDTCVNFLTKQAVWVLRESTPRAVREGLTSRCARSLACYRRHCASPSSAGQLVLPESMKLLPLYTNCLLRSDAVAGGPELTCDDRSCAMYRALTADVAASAAHTYPRLLPLLSRADAAPLRASVDKMSDRGVYLLENGVHMLLWVGAQAPAEFVRDVFGVSSPQQIDTQVCELPELDNANSARVRGLVDEIRVKRRSAMRLTLMRQHDKLETVLRHFLVEDRGVDGSASYVDFLCHIHKEVRALL
ncbi:protein transport protein Sec24C isoform X1 [Plodia interpunctella]|uniref:protein transport protein Sec24C isoform X1 n=1 Tax=Plodia interpunctella TaxID=58824 RepID=UPI002368155E|nr:protein transport protein Sec24C isoform X1 [Plodia interpunctella]